jgi:predicted DNA-binding ribbon-helix-helix protein
VAQMISFDGVDIDGSDIDMMELHSDDIDMGDGTRRRVVLPLAYWHELKAIVTEDGVPLAEIIADCESETSEEKSFDEALIDIISGYFEADMEDEE